MRVIFSAVAMFALAVPAAANAQAAAAPAAVAATTKAHYTIQETDLGTMLDDPAAKAILAKSIPNVVNNPQVEMGRSLTLAQLQQYAGDSLTDEALKTIQASLDAAAPK
ncbi:hypothetical protein ACFSCW_06365 [Sphingomonas tabacisoli]|uniref:Uncharacterized protein n=1 Tax=Sphingomonas tabacisoli TaxID=2249466 RepID=A0ABW4I1T6_9SPHN